MLDSPKKNINHIDLVDNVSVGNVRQREILQQPFNKAAVLPKTVTLRDMDDAFKDWVKTLRMVAEDGTEYPTISLFSNQRFSEYSQSWSHTDDNNNLLLNFKTVTRDNNPQYGKIQSGLWNIPGDRFYRIKRYKVLDENGSESLVDLSMRQPTAVDLQYKMSLFTNKYESINEFNIKVNKLFRARQCYLAPNGYFMPMVLDNISDESEYSIDDRQFYSQTYQVTLKGYVIEEEDLRQTEIPLKRGVHFTMMKSNKKKPDITIDETERDTVLTAYFPPMVNSAEFTMDEDFIIGGFKYNNVVRNIRIFCDDEEIDPTEGVILKGGVKVKILVKHRNPMKESSLLIMEKK